MMGKVAKAEKKMRSIQQQDNDIHICPNCGSKKTNQVTKNNYFCMDCDSEFNKKNMIYSIQYDGELVPYYENEFADIV